MAASFSPLDESDAAPFFEAAQRGELRIQTCSACGRRRFPPRPMCPWCHSLESEWRRQSGRGRIWSFAVPHPPLLPPFVDESPYVVVVVELEEDPLIRLVGNVVRAVNDPIGAVPAEELHIGANVVAVFGTSIEGYPVPQWVVRLD